MHASFLNNVNICGILSVLYLSTNLFKQFKNQVMKQILSLIAIAAVTTVVVVMFTNKTKDEKISSIEMAEFKAWQESNEQAELLKAETALIKAETAKPVAKKTVTYQSPKAVSTSQNEAKVPEETTTEKKGWSKSAKGAVIGAASGAVIGAVINKRNRAAGAAIGGVIGGGVGFGIGKTLDKKDGRS